MICRDVYAVERHLSKLHSTEHGNNQMPCGQQTHLINITPIIAKSPGAESRVDTHG